MENRADTPARGPLPARRGPRLSAARRAILELLRDQAEPVRLAALVTLTRFHENTLREHLDGLVRAGLVRRERAPASGRGRPAWLYSAVHTDPDAPEYAGLAAVLARVIVRNSVDPVSLAAAAGEEWGGELARNRGALPEPPEAARQHVIDLMADLGFGPEVSADAPDDVALTRCPLLEAAHQHTGVVCAVHLGLVRGALQEHGADSTGTELFPFSDPGACRLRLPAPHTP